MCMYNSNYLNSASEPAVVCKPQIQNTALTNVHVIICYFHLITTFFKAHKLPTDLG